MSAVGYPIKECKPKVHTKAYRKKERGFDIRGAGTYSTLYQAIACRVAAEMRASELFLSTLSFDNNHGAVMKAKSEVSQIHPTPKEILLHPLKTEYFRAFFYSLRAENVYGFNRSPEKAVKSLPLYFNQLVSGVEEVERYELNFGGDVFLRLQPCSFSSHCVSQWIINTISGKADLNIGSIAIPNEVSAISTFKRLFPIYIASDYYGYDGAIIYDNSHANIIRSIRKIDELVLRGFDGTITAFMWDGSYPAAGDIWSTLFRESSFVGVAAVEKPLELKRDWRRPWRLVADRDAVARATRAGIEQVMHDPTTRLIDADMPLDIPQFIVVSGRARLEDLQKAVAGTLVPSSITVLAAPSSTKAITATRFCPLKGNIESIERLWKIQSRRKYGEPYRLPDKIMAKEIESILPVIDQVADYMRISRDVLLEGSNNKPIQIQIEKPLMHEEEGVVKIRRRQRSEK